MVVTGGSTGLQALKIQVSPNATTFRLLTDTSASILNMSLVLQPFRPNPAVPATTSKSDLL
ncbi:MAG: hypothetical protein Q9170_007816 [Blastenia crenularia]